MVAEDSKSMLEQWAKVNEMVAESERLFMRASLTYHESLGGGKNTEQIKKALDASRDAYNKSIELRDNYQKQLETQLESAPELRQHLNEDVEFCNIAMRVAMETLQKHCGTVQQVTGLVARARDITVRSYEENGKKWLAECPFCKEPKPEAFDWMTDENYVPDDPRHYLGQQYHCRKCDRYYNYYESGDIIVLEQTPAAEPKKNLK